MNAGNEDPNRNAWMQKYLLQSNDWTVNTRAQLFKANDVIS